METELKFTGVDLNAVRSTLQASGAQCQGRVFERNLVFDTPGRDLRRTETLLRLRSDSGPHGARFKLTFKRSPQGPVEEGVKVWDETETEVMDFDAMRGVLEGLGYTVAFAYEKVRETWTLECGGHRGLFCLDRLPFGDVVEIEAVDRAAIRACAARAGLADASTTTATYHQLNREHREEQGLETDENFVFDQKDFPILENSVKPKC